MHETIRTSSMGHELNKRGTSLVLVASCLAMLSVEENSTAIMAALPAMTQSLRLGPATVEWVVNAYLLASAMFIVMRPTRLGRAAPPPQAPRCSRLPRSSSRLLRTGPRLSPPARCKGSARLS